MVIRTEELHGKNAAFFEKVEHGKCPQIHKTSGELAVTAKMTGPWPEKTMVWSLP